MQQATMSLQSVGSCLPCKDNPAAKSQLHMLKSKGRWSRRRLLVTNGTPQGKEPNNEVRLDRQDLMTIEFGRLLGESKDHTIAKVLRRKLDPDSSYVKLEKDAKVGKEIIKKSDFPLKVKQIREASSNDSLFSSNVPQLSSRPWRQNGGQANLPKSAEQEALQESLLRRPVSSQRLKSVPAVALSKTFAINNNKNATLQSEKAADLDKLRRPSLDERRNALKESTSLPSVKHVRNCIPQEKTIPKDKEVPVKNDSFDAAKLDFENIFETSSNASTSFASTDEMRSDLALKSSDSVNTSTSLPKLASPPRLHDSKGVSIQPNKKNRAIGSFTKNAPNKLPVDELLLQKPGVHAGSDVTLASVQFIHETHSFQDDQSQTSSIKDGPHSDEASEMPQLAGPPSKPRLIGELTLPRKLSSTISEDSAIDESLLRKPRISLQAAGPPASTMHSELLQSVPQSSKQLDAAEDDSAVNVLVNHQGDDMKPSAIQGDSQTSLSQDDASTSDFKKPVGGCLQKIVTSDDASNIINDFSRHKDGRSVVENNDMNLVLKTEPQVSRSKQPSESRTLDTVKVMNKGSNANAHMEELRTPEDVLESAVVSNLSSEDIKKPVRVSWSNLEDKSPSKASEGKMTGKPNGNNHLKAIYKDEEVVDASSTLTDQTSDSKKLLNSIPKESIFGHPQRNDRGRQKEVQRDIASETEQPKSIDLLQKPSHDKENSSNQSKLMILEASNSKLHRAKEEEEKDWSRVEALFKSKEQIEVKIIGSSSTGLVVPVGCLVGFLPSSELSPKRGLTDFGSWAQQKGYTLSQDKSMQIKSEGLSNASETSEEVKLRNKTEVDLSGLRMKYQEETLKLLANFVGERTKVIIKLLDKGRRRLRVSEKEAEPGYQNHLQKKASLMAELKLGDVITCQVKSITPIGVFVEVDGVAALIHHSELSWNTRVDPTSLLGIGEVIKAKVCRLDRVLQRINLSLKQMQPDPLKRTLESVIEDFDTNSSLHEIEEENWPELEDLIRKLEQMDHISRVTKGRCLHSTAFAPSFQVLISTPQNNGYKLLARFENKIREILVDTILDCEKMKECIRQSTFSKA